ncbi:MAG: NAD(P)H-dependent oxidoreductase [Bacteroidota bacterium]
MNITLLLGSIREGRKSDRVALHLHSLLKQEEDIHPTLIDLKEWPLPQYSYRWKENEQADPNLLHLAKILHGADGLIFISPEYHGSYTGVLKNALDHYWGEFAKKPIGVVSTGSGRMGGINASTEMQQLVLSIGAFPMPRKLIVPHVQDSFTPEGIPTHEVMAKESNKFIQDYLWFSKALFAAKEKMNKASLKA